MLPMKSNQGSALLTALFIMTLVAIVATAMTSRLQLDIYRTQLILNQDKLYLASQAVTFWALDALNNPQNHFNKLLKQGSVANYPSKMRTLEKNIDVRGSLYDLQSQFNLNNLSEKDSILGFIRLISQALPKTSPAERVQLALAVADWIHDYDPSLGKDNYAAYYLAQNPPYNTSHQLMQSKSELRLVKDISAAHYLALEPLITALPESTPVNINTASEDVLMSLANGVGKEKVNLLISARSSKEIMNLNTIKDLLEKLNLASKQLSTQSKYFLCVASLSMGDHQLFVYTLLQRNRNKKNQVSTAILRVSLNGF